MTLIIPPETRYIQVPETSGARRLSPAMAVIMAIAYNRAEKATGSETSKSLSEAKWRKLMGPDERQCAGLTTWSETFQSKTKSALMAHGLMISCDGGYRFMRPRPFLLMPIMILTHPELTVGRKVHWARYCRSTSGKVGCVHAWCGHDHSGPISKSHALHAVDFVRRGLATVSNGCYRLIPLNLVASNQPELLTSKLSDSIQYWSRHQDEARLVKMIQDRDAVARAWANRLSHGDERQDVDGWKQFNAELSQIAMRAKTRRDLLTLGYSPDLGIGRSTHLHLEAGEWLLNLSDFEGIANNPTKRNDLCRDGKRSLEGILGFAIF